MLPTQLTKYSDPNTLRTALESALARSGRDAADTVWNEHTGARPEVPELDNPEAWAWAVELFELTPDELARARAAFDGAVRQRWAELHAAARVTVAP